MTDLPPYLRPFVLDHEPVDPVRSGVLDLYLPPSTPAPAVLMVHGGPVGPQIEVRPPAWPAFRGYGALLAHAGVAGAMFEHSFTSAETLDGAVDDVHGALASLRADDRVDGDRVALWFFSGGGFLMGSFLESAPDGVVAIAGTYAAVAAPDFVSTTLPQAVDTAPAGDVHLLLVRPEHDFDWIASGTDELLRRTTAAGREVDVIDVPGAEHGFENANATEEARDAIRASVAWLARQLTA